MSGDSTDPFLTFKNKVSGQVEKLQIDNERYSDFVKNNDTSQSEQSGRLLRGLVKDLKKAEEDLRLLHGGVDNVRKNRMKFPHINDAELQQRQRIVDDMQNCLKGVKAAMESPLIRKKLESDDIGARNRDASKNGGAVTSNSAAQVQADNSLFIKKNGQIIKDTIKDQDKLLNDLDIAVTRLSLTSNVLHTEIEEQTVLVDNLGKDMDNAGDKMGVVMTALDKLLKRKDGCHIWILVILAVILAILVALVIWI